YGHAVGVGQGGGERRDGGDRLRGRRRRLRRRRRVAAAECLRQLVPDEREQDHGADGDDLLLPLHLRGVGAPLRAGRRRGAHGDDPPAAGIGPPAASVPTLPLALGDAPVAPLATTPDGSAGAGAVVWVPSPYAYASTVSDAFTCGNWSAPSSNES